MSQNISKKKWRNIFAPTPWFTIERQFDQEEYDQLLRGRNCKPKERKPTAVPLLRDGNYNNNRIHDVMG